MNKKNLLLTAILSTVVLATTVFVNNNNNFFNKSLFAGSYGNGLNEEHGFTISTTNKRFVFDDSTKCMTGTTESGNPIFVDIVSGNKANDGTIAYFPSAGWVGSRGKTVINFYKDNSKTEFFTFNKLLSVSFDFSSSIDIDIDISTDELANFKNYKSRYTVSSGTLDLSNINAKHIRFSSSSSCPSSNVYLRSLTFNYLCGGEKIEKEIKSIELTSKPSKLRYEINSEINLNGLKITGFFDDERWDSEDITNLCSNNLTSTDMTTSGTKKIVFSYGDFSVNFDIEVISSDVDSLVGKFKYTSFYMVFDADHTGYASYGSDILNFEWTHTGATISLTKISGNISNFNYNPFYNTTTNNTATLDGDTLNIKVGISLSTKRVLTREI